MILAPLCNIRSSKSSSSDTTVRTIGISTKRDNSLIISVCTGALSTTAAAPCNSASKAILNTLAPLVVPPPTPTKTGCLATPIIALVI